MATGMVARLPTHFVKNPLMICCMCRTGSSSMFCRGDDPKWWSVNRRLERLVWETYSRDTATVLWALTFFF